MKIVTLVENTSDTSELEHEHGLSLYIETEKHKILFDTGSTGMFARNAEKLGVDLTQVDTVILSHGHYDHAGGIETFLKLNTKALIYMRSNAFEEHYHCNAAEEKYIGLDRKLKENPRIRFLDGNQELDEELFLFTNVMGRKSWPVSNQEMKQKTENGFIQDDFTHEENLVITQHGKKYLLSGCSHNGVINILDEYRKLFLKEPEIYMGGFHLIHFHSAEEYTPEEEMFIQKFGSQLKEMKTEFYTGHCTGEEAYQILKKVMGDKLHPIHTGTKFLFE